ncbi:histidine kinase [Nonomuraea sp. NPDC049784]|uniref:histidine kinase n=1 Tax=Nonomuraea sp. NPDC049784 TaxID=3154361 RepID=UPI0034115776
MVAVYDGGRTAPAPRLAAVIPAAFLCLTLFTRFGNAVYWSGLAGGMVLAGLFVLPMLYTVPRGRRLWTRHRDMLLAVQAGLTYAPLAVFGQNWINIAPALLVGLLLVTVNRPGAWLLSGAVLAGEAVRIAVLGVPWPGSGVAIIIWMLVAPANTGLAFFGLVRLADMVTALHQARTELADLAIKQERRRSAEHLRTIIGDRLETVTRHAGTALSALRGDPDLARAQLAEAARRTRQALDEVRTVVAADQQGPDPRPGAADEGDGRTGRAEVAPRLARLTLVVVLTAYAPILMSNILVAGGPPVAMAGAVGTMVAVAALQLHHSFGWRGRSRPRAWPWTLLAQTLLPYAWLPAYDWNVLTLAGLAAGSGLLLLPRRWAWTMFAAVMVSVGVAWSLPVLGLYYGVGNRFVQVVATDNATVLYQIGAVATVGIVVYGLSRLTDLAEQVETIRRELARTAVERERLRVARDTHDLLGLGLSAVALKSDLAARLIGRDDARARTELQALLRLSAQGRAEARAVAAETRTLSLRAELAAAHDLLAPASIEVDVRDDAIGEPLPPAVDTVLATVLREAVTNVLRHAKPSRCEIELTADQGEIQMCVTNDGIPAEPNRELEGEHEGRPRQRAGGRGLASLAARAAALDGTLSTHANAETGQFRLTVRIRLPS